MDVALVGRRGVKQKESLSRCWRGVNVLSCDNRAGLFGVGAAADGVVSVRSL